MDQPTARRTGRNSPSGAAPPRAAGRTRCALVWAALAVLLPLVAGGLARADEVYLGANPSPTGTLVLVGLRDGTPFTVSDLETGGELASETVDRAGVFELDLAGVHRFVVRADAPVLAHLGHDCCAVGGSTFVPTEDGHAMVGRAFLLYLPVVGVQSDLAVLAYEDARVVLSDLDGTVLSSRTIEAGRAWTAYPVVGRRPYLVRASGDVAVVLSAVNGLTTVPPASREESCDADVGRRFLLLTHSWGGGGVAAFAYEDAEVTLMLAGRPEVVASEHLLEGEWCFFHDLGRRVYELRASGEVAVWAGDLEGGATIDFLGDDFSVNLGRRGLDVVFHGQSHGGVVLAAGDETAVEIDGAPYLLGSGEWVDVAAGQSARAKASAPVVALTFGGNELNDWGGFLRPAPFRPADQACPELDAGMPDGDGDGDADLEADADLAGDGDGEADAAPPDGEPDGLEGGLDADGPETAGPRPSCDCAAAGVARSRRLLGLALLP